MRKIIAQPSFFAAISVALLVAIYLMSPIVEALNTQSIEIERNSDQYLYTSDSSSLDITGDLTIESWVMFDSLPSSGDTMAIAGKYDFGDDNRAYYLGYTKVLDTYKFRFTTSSACNNFTEGDLPYTLNTDNWYHVAVSKSGSIATFYVNGNNIGTANVDSTQCDSSADFTVGALINGTSDLHFDGLLDDVRVWNVARSAADIEEYMTIELTGAESGLVAYWKFNGESLEDATENNHDLTNVNGATFSNDVPFLDEPVLSPEEQAENLVTDLLAYELPKNIENALLANLKKVASFIVEGKVDAAKAQLLAFLEKVEAYYVDGDITAESRDQLTAAAEATLVALE